MICAPRLTPVGRPPNMAAMTASDRPAGFGMKLREARERRGVTLRQIANATKISVAALEALERGDVSRLPGGIFSRAFVRSYALEVGLDPDEAIREFAAQYPSEATTARASLVAEIDAEALDSRRKIAATLLWVGGLSVLAAVLLWRIIPSPTAPPLPAVQTRPASSTSIPDPAASVPPPGSPSQPSDVMPQSGTTPSQPGAAAPQSRESSSQSGDSLLRPVTAGQPAAASTTDTAPDSEAGRGRSPLDDRAPDRPAPAAADASNVLTVGLRATGACWVSAVIDGRRTIAREFSVGEQQTVQVPGELVLTAGDAAALVVTVNGAAVKPLGKAGQVVTTRLNTTNFRSYLAGQ
jgi:cytoskeleton protein RodZ